MTQIVTISAVTAAYAAQAVKPSARVSGDGPSHEAVTLLDARPKSDGGATLPAPVGAMPNSAHASLMLISAQRGLPQGTQRNALARYIEMAYGDDEPEDDTEPDERDPR